MLFYTQELFYDITLFFFKDFVSNIHPHSVLYMITCSKNPFKICSNTGSIDSTTSFSLDELSISNDVSDEHVLRPSDSCETNILSNETNRSEFDK